MGVSAPPIGGSIPRIGSISEGWVHGGGIVSGYLIVVSIVGYIGGTGIRSLSISRRDPSSTHRSVLGVIVPTSIMRVPVACCRTAMVSGGSVAIATRYFLLISRATRGHPLGTPSGLVGSINRGMRGSSSLTSR